MTLIAFVAVTFGFAGLAIVLRRRREWVTIVGFAGLGATVVSASLIDPAQTVGSGAAGLATSDYLRLFLVLGSIAGLGLAVAGLAGGTRRDAPAVTLAVLGASALTIGLVDPRAAVLVATAGGLCGVLVTLVPNGGRAGATVGIREVRAVVLAGTLAIVATAWIERDLSGLSAQPVVVGLAYLAFAVAVAIRFGTIPFHLWAARLTDVVPETSLPILTALAPASLAVVALAWISTSVAPLEADLLPERTVVLVIAIVTVVLASVAAFIQDDIEHVLGYSIVADAAIVVLALASTSPDAWAPARFWILALVVARSAFAAWTAAIRTGFHTGRVADLRGWARRSPILVVAFGLVMVAGVGYPGLAAFDARVSIVDATVDPPFSSFILIAVLAPVLYYARLLVIGLFGPDRINEPVEPWRPRLTLPDVGAIGRWLRGTWDVNRAFTTATVAALLAILALGTAAGAFDGPAVAGRPPTVAVPGRVVVPLPSRSAVPTPAGESAAP